MSKESREKRKAAALWLLEGWMRKLHAMEADGCDPLDVAEVRERVQRAAMNWRWAHRGFLKADL